VGSQKLVLDYSPQLEGLQPDMPLQQALSRHGEIELIQADIPYYWSAFNEYWMLWRKEVRLSKALTWVGLYRIDGLQLIYPTHRILVKPCRKLSPGIFLLKWGIAEGKFPAYLSALHSAPNDYTKIAAGTVKPS